MFNPEYGGERPDYEDTSRGMLSAAMDRQLMEELREKEERRYAE